MTTDGFRERDPPPWPETADERAARLEREREMLEVGRQDLRAGRFITGPKLEARLQAFVRGELRKPTGRRGK